MAATDFSPASRYSSSHLMAQPISPTLFAQFARGWRGYLLVALIALISAQLGAARMPVLDADEARFAQATRQMIESGDYVRIRLQDQERNKKPIGAYWAQAASVQAFSPERLNNIWSYRLPSTLGLMLAALATLWGGAALIGQRAAFLGAGLFAASMLAGFEGMIAKADALLVGFTTLAIAALAHLYAKPRGRALALVFWLAIGCGILIKGPITPLAAALTLIALGAWERRWAWMRPLLWWPGPVLACLVVAPWFIAISQATEGRFLSEMFFGDIAPKLISGDEGHFGPPGYHTFLLPFLIFPATYALPAAARLAWEALRAPRSEEQRHRFLLAWALPLFLLFEITPTKLPHYVLPAYPAICLLCGSGLGYIAAQRWRTAHPAGLVLFAVAGVALAALTAFGATLLPGDLNADLRRAISALLIGLFVVGGALIGLFMLRRPAARAAVLIACALVLSFNLRDRMAPESRALFVSDEAVAALTRARLLPQDDRTLWVVGYRETSIVFLTRTDTRLVDPEQVGARAHAGDSLVVEGRVLDAAQTALNARGLSFTPAEPPARGFALASGRSVALYVGRVEPAAD